MHAPTPETFATTVIGWPAFCRRSSRRHSYRLPCRVRLTAAGDCSAALLCGHTTNLSDQGLALHLGVSLAENVGVEVLLLDEEGLLVRLQGRVQRSRRMPTGRFEVAVRLDSPFA